MWYRADEGLALLICLCGFKNVTTLVHKGEMMKDFFILLNEIKAQTLEAFCLTLSEIEEPANELINIIEADEDDTNKECKEMEEFLNDNM